MTMRARVRRWLRWPLVRRSTVERLQRELDKMHDLCRQLERRSSIAALNAHEMHMEAIRQHERARKIKPARSA